MEKENKVNVLDELNKGATMGIDAINFVIDKVKDNELKKVLKKQCQDYQDISDRICNLYPEYSEKKPHETNIVNKVMTWYGIEMKTMMDDTSSKIAELIMQGTNMGIIEGRRLLNNKGSDEEINEIVRDYVKSQEDSLEKLKQFL